jgi:hypothetical protein
MPFGSSVHRPIDRSQLSATGLSRVRVITGDPFAAFCRRALVQKPVRLSLVSPWLSPRTDEASLTALIEHAARNEATIFLVTRPPTSSAHTAAIELVRSTHRGQVHLNPSLHGKLYICESKGGRGFAVVGSANCTSNSARLDEIAIMLTPHRNSRILSTLTNHGLVALLDDGRPN